MQREEAASFATEDESGPAVRVCKACCAFAAAVAVVCGG